MDVGGLHVERARGGTDDEQLVAHAELAGLDEELTHAKARKILQALAHILFLLRGVRAVHVAPLAEPLSQIVAVPEPPVEHGGQPPVPRLHLLGSERALLHGLHGLLVATHHGEDVFCAACPSFDFEHSHAGRHHLVDEPYRFQVFGTHDVFVVHVELYSRFAVTHRIAAAAHLHTLSPVGRPAEVVEREVAFATHGHTQRTVAEHFDAQQLARRPADVLFLDEIVDFGHLFQVQLARQHHHVGKGGVKA